ncbi:FAD-dependent oxidoreductase (plasmid) [Parasedimentitalea marina]|uniref:FAD-dependent oxidoreductase n=1 Tax=Parasedimentitalea marina TaxID=2483033 RepID=A0A3T0NAC8_9RHOB|nr:FAD-dependent oxidoreductase [Parasedimentitalea marina]AZV80939.1 FAD-dependent oxidoreductase [Parasedimentitalea marina]
METSARVVIIGGGVVGCSILYHLAKRGWKDVVLLERQELTAGSSWHAAGNLFTLTAPGNAAILQKYTIDLYPELEKESGQDCGLHYNSELLVAKDEEEIKTLSIAHAFGKRYGIESEFISAEQAKKLAPTLNTDDLTAILHEKSAGYCDPSSVTHAFAKAARNYGASIHRHTPVLETNQRHDGKWDVVTENGTITTDYVVNAAGLWGREVAALAGITLPLMPVEHHYLVTEEVPEMANLETPHALLSYADANLYMRPEGKGLLIGAYESKCVHWAEDGTPLEFGHELLPDDLSRMEDEFLQAVELMPCLAEAGIKSVINGPMIFSPDLGPLIGPYPGKPGYICANGVMTGFNQGGGIGKVLAEWIIDGEPSLDVSFWDVARYGDYADSHYTKEMTKYWYENRSSRVYPYQTFPAARPMKMSPIHDRLKEAGAVFGETCGWEDAYWYPKNDAERVEEYSYERPAWFAAVARESRAVRETAGLFELTSYGKYMFSGAGAVAFLDRILANKIPELIGKTALCPMLSEMGKVIGDFTVTRLGPERCLVLGSGSMEKIHERWFLAQLPDAGVSYDNLTNSYAGLHVAGPNARAILQTLAPGTSFESADFPFLSGREMALGSCPDALVVRVSYTGECGYEIYMPLEHQAALYDKIIEAGEPHGLTLAGGHALMALRLEKGFAGWGMELTSDYYPNETALARFVRYGKGDFIGRKAALAAKEAGPRESFVQFAVDTKEADPYGGEPVFKDGELVGYTSSGGFGYCAGTSLALGYLQPESIDPDAVYQVDIVGKKCNARLLSAPPVDPEGLRMRR